jgi:predicted nuclease with TOPRIM domain
MLTNKIKLTVIGLAILAIISWLGLKSCRLTDNLSKLKGEYEVYKKNAMAENEKLNTACENQIAIINKFDKQIKDTEGDIAHKDEAIKNKSNQISALEKELAGISDKDAKIANLTKQVEAWKEQFSLAQAIIVDKDKIIYDWSQKYDAQVVISDSWKKKYENELQLRQVAEKGWKAAEWGIKTARLASNVKSLAIIAIGGYLTYKLLKEK